MNRIVIIAIAFVSLVGLQAEGSITFNDSLGTLSAQAVFDAPGGGLLVVTLSNTSSTPTNVNADILTALFFNIDSNPSLTRVSAVLGGTSKVWDNVGSQQAPDWQELLVQPAGGVVGGEWAYGSNIQGASPNGANQGISSAGFTGGMFPESNNFPGPDLQSPAEVDGPQYGLMPAGGIDPASKQQGALIKNSVVFTLSGYQGNLGDIAGVWFQYGTALFPVDPGFGDVIPEPASVVIWSVLGAGAAAGGLALRRRRAPARGHWSEENRKAIFEIIEQGRA